MPSLPSEAEIAAAHADGVVDLAAHGYTHPDRATAAFLAPAFTQPAPVTAAEAATAQVLDDLPAPPVTVDLDQLADPAPLAWYTAIEEWDEQLAELAEKRERAVEIIQAAMGDAEEARIKGRLVITWKTSKPTKRVDRKKLEADLGADVVTERYLTESKAARPFRILPRRGAR
jgi:hypothetical protein